MWLLFRLSIIPTDPPVLFCFHAEDGIRAFHVTGVQTCALPISTGLPLAGRHRRPHQCAEAPIWAGPLPIPRRSRHGTLGWLGAAGPQPPSDQPFSGRPDGQVTAEEPQESAATGPPLQFLQNPAHRPGFAPEIS